MKLKMKVPTQQTLTTTSTAELSEYKGNSLLVLKASADTKYPFQFGVSKARLILQHIDDIKAFVDSNGGSI
jgi:hypothetical protein